MLPLQTQACVLAPALLFPLGWLSETTLPGRDDQGMGLPEPAMGREATPSEPSPFAPLPALP